MRVFKHSRLWLICLLFVLVFSGFAISDVRAQKTEETSESEMLAYLLSAKQLDEKCRVLNKAERDGLNLKIDLLAAAMGTNTNELTKRLSSSYDAIIKLPCDNKLALNLFNIARNDLPSKALEQKGSDDTSQKVWIEIQENWRSIFADLPKGKLGAFEGCWLGLLNGYKARLCIFNKGDVVQFKLGENSKPQCLFQDGAARQRQGYIMFFAIGRSRKCEDSSVLQHIEGACQPFQSTSMECILSLYSSGNIIYTTKNGTPVSGTVILRRE